MAVSFDAFGYIGNWLRSTAKKEEIRPRSGHGDSAENPSMSTENRSTRAPSSTSGTFTSGFIMRTIVTRAAVTGALTDSMSGSGAFGGRKNTTKKASDGNSSPTKDRIPIVGIPSTFPTLGGQSMTILQTTDSFCRCGYADGRYGLTGRGNGGGTASSD